MASLALVAALLGQLVGVSASHSHGAGASSDASAPIAKACAPGTPTTSATAHDRLHCEGCSSRADAKRRTADTVRRDETPLYGRRLLLDEGAPLPPCQRQLTRRLPARGPPVLS